MDWTLEVVILPVSDIEASIAFYRDKVGFELDHDTTNEHMHVVQMTPRGSGCSIVFGDLPSHNQMAPGSMREGVGRMVRVTCKIQVTGVRSDSTGRHRSGAHAFDERPDSQITRQGPRHRHHDERPQERPTAHAPIIEITLADLAA